MRFKKTVLALSLSIALSACGGGGGGENSTPPTSVLPPLPPPPPPPPPPNMAPTLSVEVSSLQIDEHTPFTIDLSNSTDSDGQIVRFDVRQPNPLYYAAVPVAAVDGVFEFVAPEVFFHEGHGVGTLAETYFDVEIEDDDGSIVRDQVSVIFQSTAGATRAEGISEYFSLNLSEEVVLFSDNRPTPSFNYVFGTRADSSPASSTKEIVLLDGVDSAVWNVLDVIPKVLADTVPGVDSFFPGVFSFDLAPGTRQQFAVISTDQDKIFWFAAFDRVDVKDYVLDEVIDIEAPCHVQGRTNSSQDIAWVGQKNAGLSVIRLLPDRPTGGSHEGFSFQVVSTAETSRSLCFVYPTRLPSMGSSSPPISQLDDLIAIDFDLNELVLLADYVPPAEEYELIGTIPIDTDGLSNLNIVDVLGIGDPGSVPNVIFVLMSDGLENGEHRLVVVWQDQNGNIQQKPHTFVGGVPSAMHSLSFFPSEPEQLVDAGADVVIVSSSSSQVTIFEDDGINVNPTLSLIPALKAPIYFDVGDIPSSSSIVRLPNINGANQSSFGLVLSFSGRRDLRVFTYMD